VFARETNSASIVDHNLWQYAELHFGEEGYKLQEGVDVRADVIVNGPPGAVGADQQRGLRYPQWNIQFVWFGHDVPVVSGSPDHIHPGSLVTITLETFGPSMDPLVLLMPLRSVAITIPALDPDGNGYVRFQGTFGLQPDDPYSLWRYLIKNAGKVTNVALTFVDDTSTSTTYGASGSFNPTPTPNGSATVFTIPFGYIVGSTQVYLRAPGAVGGLLLLPGTDYTESDPIGGEITLTSPPATGSVLLVVCRTLSS
jgi:hypothetical protein